MTADLLKASFSSVLAFFSFIREVLKIYLFCSIFSAQRQLSVVKCGETNIPAKEMITYTKQTQTTASGPERDGNLILHISVVNWGVSGPFHIGYLG